VYCFRKFVSLCLGDIPILERVRILYFYAVIYLFPRVEEAIHTYIVFVNKLLLRHDIDKRIILKRILETDRKDVNWV
jgi:hypothetical protein